jgi:hypothetical protein
MTADIDGRTPEGPAHPDEWVPTPDRPYRTLSDEQVTHMNRLQAWAHQRGDKPDLREWVAGDHQS